MQEQQYENFAFESERGFAKQAVRDRWSEGEKLQVEPKHIGGLSPYTIIILVIVALVVLLIVFFLLAAVSVHVHVLPNSLPGGGSKPIPQILPKSFPGGGPKPIQPIQQP
ncbi:MAG TPA: hypothetical protein VH593_04030 [Ktedonobacteraceae bacterium]|jgi:hypothetical protein